MPIIQLSSTKHGSFLAYDDFFNLTDLHKLRPNAWALGYYMIIYNYCPALAFTNSYSKLPCSDDLID